MHKITLFIRSLNKGGAERQLLYLARGLQDLGHTVTVLTLYPPAPDWYPHDDITLHHLGKKSRWDIIGFIKTYVSFLKAENPDVIYSFLTVQNIIACLSAPFIRSTVICGVRASDMDLSHYSKLDQMLDWVEKLLFRITGTQIISNSYAGKNWIVQRYPSLTSKIDVIHNGLDLTTCTYSEQDRIKYRSLWNVQDNEILIGHVGRYDPMKDHETFIKAAKIILKTVPNARFVCWGHGTEKYTHHIKDIAHNNAVPIIWYYEPRNPSYSVFDLYCSSSAFGEGHSNTLTEAMAHGIPCISTDVGDAQLILGSYGTVVPKSNPELLAEKIIQKIKNSEININTNQIKWVEQEFSVNSLVKNILLKIS
ncbi:MAG: glycosyltransferase [Candidatus Paracaedibacteraceae bacterium]|nr:glycosyltransferase [Candidatus Paracaedibacteraceae bacterium]